jgi:hypothetical protein
MKVSFDMKQFLQQRLNKINARYVAAVVAVSPLMANAATTFDTSTITEVITAVAAATALIGAAVVAMKYGVKAWKWIGSAG